jgi:two-component system response regulator MprA
MRILVVDDDQAVRDSLRRSLAFNGYEVEVAGDGLAALESIARQRPDALVLDVMMPRLDGLEACRRLRSAGEDLPILVLTARDAVSDRVAGLDAGADDYLTKPFHFGELMARVRALTRRRALPVLPDRVECGRLALNTRTREAWVDSEPIDLTAREYALLEYLCRKEGAVIAREEIAEHVWDDRYDSCSNVIDVYVQRLRRKLDRGSRSFIRTRRGAGYQFIGRQEEAR